MLWLFARALRRPDLAGFVQGAYVDQQAHCACHQHIRQEVYGKPQPVPISSLDRPGGPWPNRFCGRYSVPPVRTVPSPWRSGQWREDGALSIAIQLSDKRQKVTLVPPTRYSFAGPVSRGVSSSPQWHWVAAARRPSPASVNAPLVAFSALPWCGLERAPSAHRLGLSETPTGKWRGAAVTDAHRDRSGNSAAVCLGGAVHGAPRGPQRSLGTIGLLLLRCQNARQRAAAASAHRSSAAEVQQRLR